MLGQMLFSFVGGAKGGGETPLFQNKTFYFGGVSIVSFIYF
jgi:hypothetical protein